MRERVGAGSCAGEFCLARAQPWGTGSGGLKMVAGLVWRMILFFGLTAGYAILAALPYMA